MAKNKNENEIVITRHRMSDYELIMDELDYLRELLRNVEDQGQISRICKSESALVKKLAKIQQATIQAAQAEAPLSK